jgi:hypothetical protein
MFGLFRKKKAHSSGAQSLEEGIARDGLDHAALRVSQIVCRDKIPTKAIACRFVMQDFDGASNGNAESIAWVNSMGFDESQYKGALSSDDIEVDGPEGPQMFLNMLGMKISDDNVRAKFRMQVTENIMRHFDIYPK